ncbi:methylthioribulose 1-phosphate dehydratase [Streptomyces zagrosensis]|uniref:Methylthioribulose-1-phosphate dehydratase n=1 Tax=Streptomyces zagrosensis TaxID=1042984 RepID=A0A7W9QCL4_9ACTN|nr:methylthioribulose 1-phosphate dehydratase [Streptomyces zagrosensis]MBB5937303.1 methylthioribose-1-phosphate isomerase [Streptomyces zagrosensis]
MTPAADEAYGRDGAAVEAYGRGRAVEDAPLGDQAAADRTVCNQTAPEETAPDETAPEETAPDETASDQDAQQLTAFSRTLYGRGWMPGTAGNLSVRRPGATVLITASGRAKGELTARDMVVVHADTGAEVSRGELRASAETAIHCAVYGTTHARAVIHVHSPYATAIASRTGHPTRLRMLRVERFELLKGLGLADPTRTDVPVFPNWPEVPRIAADVASRLASTPHAPPGLLIADHGITTWGRDLAQARDRLECLEAICQLLLLTGTGPQAAND